MRRASITAQAGTSRDTNNHLGFLTLWHTVIVPDSDAPDLKATALMKNADAIVPRGRYEMRACSPFLPPSL